MQLIRPFKHILTKATFKTKYRLTVNLKPLQDTPLTPPFIIMGIYRSGTTLTTSLVEALGVDMGAETHKFQAIGNLAYLNPEGFQENFLLNDIGRYILYKCGGSGVRFPDFNKISNLELSSFDNTDFAYYSIKNLKDERVDSEIRKQVLSQYNISNLNQYICDYFNTSCWGFKDVHCGIYLPIYHKLWTEAKFICVFRHPSSFLNSATQVSKQVSLETWIEYYTRVIKVEENTPIRLYWINYEDLLSKDESTLRGLTAFIHNTTQTKLSYNLDTILSLIKPSLSKYSNNNNQKNDLGTASELYEKLKQKSCQKMV